MPDCGVHYLWFACLFLIRSPPPPPQRHTPTGLHNLHNKLTKTRYCLSPHHDPHLPLLVVVTHPLARDQKPQLRLWCGGWAPKRALGRGMR